MQEMSNKGQRPREKEAGQIDMIDRLEGIPDPVPVSEKPAAVARKRKGAVGRKMSGSGGKEAV